MSGPPRTQTPCQQHPHGQMRLHGPPQERHGRPCLHAKGRQEERRKGGEQKVSILVCAASLSAAMLPVIPCCWHAGMQPLHAHMCMQRTSMHAVHTAMHACGPPLSCNRCSKQHHALTAQVLPQQQPTLRHGRAVTTKPSQQQRASRGVAPART